MSSNTGNTAAVAAPLGDALRRHALADAQFLAAAARQLGLTYRDALALDHLTHGGPLSASDLAGRLHLSASGASALVHRLEAAGHVVRCGDRRGSPVRATSRAIGLLAEARAPLVSAIGELCEALAPHRRDEVARFLQAAAALAERAAGRLAGEARSRARHALAAPEPPLWA
jgi:DNA-binding MarR family transcriptional regulator